MGLWFQRRKGEEFAVAASDRKETERCLNQARQMAAALVTVTERLAELIDELGGKLRTEKEEKAEMPSDFGDQ
jgi:hypothetical protein